MTAVLEWTWRAHERPADRPGEPSGESSTIPSATCFPGPRGHRHGRRAGRLQRRAGCAATTGSSGLDCDRVPGASAGTACDALTQFGSMAEFWDWARGDGRTMFRDAPPAARRHRGRCGARARHRLVIVSATLRLGHPRLAGLAGRARRARPRGPLPGCGAGRGRCDVYLDDAPHVLRALVAARRSATVCRMVCVWNEPLPGVVDVHSWDEFEELVENVATAHDR